MSYLGELARGLGSVLNPQVAQDLANEDKQRQAMQQQVGMTLLQNELQKASPEYQARVEALKNERAFREAAAAAGGDLTKLSQAAMQFGKPEIAMKIYEGAENRLARSQQAKDALDARMAELQMRLDDKAATREQQAQYQQMMVQLRQQGLALQAQIAEGNQQLRGLGIELQGERNQIRREELERKARELSPEQKITYNAGVKEIGKEEASLTATNQVAQALKRFQELNDEVTTGRVSGMRPAILQPKLQELQQLQNWLQVNNFKPGQGQISNFERSLMKGAGPQVTNDKEANDSIIAIQLGGMQTAKERLDFKEDYIEKNKKLLGADEKWNKYVEENPRFVKDEKTGKIVKNENRKSWREYFGGGAAPKPAGDGKWSITPVPE